MDSLVYVRSFVRYLAWCCMCIWKESKNWFSKRRKGYFYTRIL